MAGRPGAEHATATAHQPTHTGGSELVSRYHRDGYVVLADALSATEVQALREEAVRICRVRPDGQGGCLR